MVEVAFVLGTKLSRTSRARVPIIDNVVGTAKRGAATLCKVPARGDDVHTAMRFATITSFCAV